MKRSIHSDIEINLKADLQRIQIKCIDHQTFPEINKGFLGVLDQIDKIPFKVLRIFFHYQISAESVRGQHAHKVCRQLMIPLQGSCYLNLKNKHGEMKFKFQEGRFAVLLPPFTWVEMSEFSEDFVGLTLADQHYNPDDYIYDLRELEGKWNDEF